LQTFDGNTGSASITVPSSSLWYEFQVTATVAIGSELIEGERSDVFTIYVPDPGLYIYNFILYTL